MLVPSQQVGCLLGKGGSVISEMRRATGANIRIFPKEQVKGASPHEEIVQVINNSERGSMFGLRLRHMIFQGK